MKKNTRHRFRRYAFFAAVFCLLFAFSFPSAAASSDVKRLKVGKTYNVKLTGKGKHKLKFTYENKNDAQGYAARYLNIFIDEKQVASLRGDGDVPEYVSWELALCRIASNRRVLYVRDKGANDTCRYMKVLEYDPESEKLIELADLAELSRNEQVKGGTRLLSPRARGNLIGAEQNRLIIEWCDTDFAIGMFYIDVPYDINGQNVKQAGTSYKLKPKWAVKTRWTSRVNLTASTKPGGKTESFRIVRGQKVTGMKVRKKGSTLYFRVKNAQGKKGWISDLTNANFVMMYGGFFKEAHFAG